MSKVKIAKKFFEAEDETIQRIAERILGGAEPGHYMLFIGKSKEDETPAFEDLELYMNLDGFAKTESEKKCIKAISESAVEGGLRFSGIRNVRGKASKHNFKNVQQSCYAFAVPIKPAKKAYQTLVEGILKGWNFDDHGALVLPNYLFERNLIRGVIYSFEDEEYDKEVEFYYYLYKPEMLKMLKEDNESVSDHCNYLAFLNLPVIAGKSQKNNGKIFVENLSNYKRRGSNRWGGCFSHGQTASEEKYYAECYRAVVEVLEG